MPSGAALGELRHSSQILSLPASANRAGHEAQLHALDRAPSRQARELSSQPPAQPEAKLADAGKQFLRESLGALSQRGAKMVRLDAFGYATKKVCLGQTTHQQQQGQRTCREAACAPDAVAPHVMLHPVPAPCPSALWHHAPSAQTLQHRQPAAERKHAVFQALHPRMQTTWPEGSVSPRLTPVSVLQQGTRCFMEEPECWDLLEMLRSIGKEAGIGCVPASTLHL